MLQLQGQALIATTLMANNSAEARSVWAVLDHAEEATTRLRLDRSVSPEIELEIRRRLPGLPERIRILQGGALDDFEQSLIVVYRDPVTLAPSLNFGSKFNVSMKHENVLALEESHAANCRVMAGLDLKNPYELEEEIREGLWHVRDLGHVGGTFFRVAPEELWARLQAQ